MKTWLNQSKEVTTKNPHCLDQFAARAFGRSTTLSHISISKMSITLTEADQKDLQRAKNLLENPGLAAKLTNLIGSPVEKGLDLLPAEWNKQIGEITQTALMKASEAAAFTMKDAPGEEASNKSHKLFAMASGAAGGLFGLAGLAIELPISTTIMMRSILDIARSEGESLSDPEIRQACLMVFALGGKSDSDNAAESGYYAVRSALAKSVSEAAEFAATKSLAEGGVPVLVRFITKVAERFGIQVTEKAAVQAVPAIGAIGGAIVNTMFMDHFQDMARGHFIVRRLERQYGKDGISVIYEQLPKLA